MLIFGIFHARRKFSLRAGALCSIVQTVHRFLDEGENTLHVFVTFSYLLFLVGIRFFRPVQPGGALSYYCLRISDFHKRSVIPGVGRFQIFVPIVMVRGARRKRS